MKIDKKEKYIETLCENVKHNVKIIKNLLINQSQAEALFNYLSLLFLGVVLTC